MAAELELEELFNDGRIQECAALLESGETEFQFKYK